MSRILIWSPNYAPELTGIAPLVTHAAEWLAARGHNVDVVAPMPNYPERRIHSEYRGALWRSEQRGRVALTRSWLRVRPNEGFADKVLYEVSYATASLPQVLRRLQRTDSLVCVVPSLIAATYAAAAARALGVVRTRPRYVVWVQDLVLSAGTVVRGVGPVARRLLEAGRSLERVAVGTADCVVTCSPGFSSYLARIGVDPDRVVTVLNGVDTDEVAALPPSQGKPLQFLYLGNLGYTQDFHSLISAMQALNGSAELKLYGEGNRVEEVRRLAETTPNVALHPPRDWDALPALLASAHVHVLVQRRGIAEANLPSKLGPYLASGRPVVAALDLDSPAAQLLRASGGAVLVPPEDPARLRDAMRKIAVDEALRLELGGRAREFAERSLSREATLGRLEHAILG